MGPVSGQGEEAAARCPQDGAAIAVNSYLERRGTHILPGANTFAKTKSQVLSISFTMLPY